MTDQTGSRQLHGCLPPCPVCKQGCPICNPCKPFCSMIHQTDKDNWQHVVFPNLKPTTETISLRMPSWLLARIKQLANERDVPYQSLIKVYLVDRVEHELNRGQVSDMVAPDQTGSLSEANPPDVETIKKGA